MSFVPEKNKRPLCPPKPVEKPLPDDKVEALRNELRLRIAALKQATIEYENKLHTLNGLAKEATSQQILYAVGNIDFSALAKQGSNAAATNTAILAAIPTIPTNYAKDTQVKDGNDTAISVGKEVRSELGTSSDTAAETGTLSAVVKWIKDKVKSIYNAITDNSTGLGAIVTKIGTPAQGQATDLFSAIGNIDFETVEQKVDEAEENIMGGKMVTYEEDYLPAAQYGTDNTDFRPVLIGDMDYTISEDDAFGLANGVAVGTVFRVMEDNSGDEHDMMSVPKTVDETTLTVASYDDEPTIEGVTEWLNFEKDKCYIVTGVYEVADGEGDTWLVYTFDEYDPGRSGREVYDKVEEVKTAVENINVESADQLAQFFGVADSYEAEAKGGERTNNTVIDECKVRFQDAFNGLLPTGFTMPNSVTVDNLTYTGTTNS